MRTSVAGVLLAAGEGSRFGRPKALVELGGQTLAEHGVALLRAGGADPILVVTGAAPIQLSGTRTVHNPEWRTGMGSSLRAALRALARGQRGETARPGQATQALPAEVGAAVVALADQPLVGAEAVARLIAAYRAGATVAVAAYDGKPRNPVLLAREHWPEVISMATGDTGARAFLRARADLVTLVECGDTGSPDDIDTAADLARITGRGRREDAPPPVRDAVLAPGDDPPGTPRLGGSLSPQTPSAPDAEPRSAKEAPPFVRDQEAAGSRAAPTE